MLRRDLRSSCFSLVALSAVLSAAASCSSDGTDSDKQSSDVTDTTPTGAAPVGSSPSPGTTSPAPAGNVLPVDETAQLVGTFLVTLQAATDKAVASTRFAGSVGDGPQPELTVWELAEREPLTGCELLTPRTPNCIPGCPTESACVEDSTCLNYPSRHDVGDVLVSGLISTDGLTEFSVKPQKPKLDYLKAASVTLQYPPAEEGSVVRLRSAGGDYSPFDISATAIAPLEVTSPEPVEMSRTAPLILTWTAPGAGDSRIEVKVDISHHGGAKGKILCNVPDSGSLEIPAELTQGLIDLGVAGYPTVELTRVSRGIGNVESGRVELQIISTDDRQLVIDGLVSCKSDDECPDGQACLVTRSCG